MFDATKAYIGTTLAAFLVMIAVGLLALALPKSLGSIVVVFIFPVAAVLFIKSFFR
jgi:hypothetical protein